MRPYKALHLLNNKLNNFNIKDDVSIVLELNGIHGLAQDYLKDKGYALLKGVERKGLGLYSIMNYILQLKLNSLEYD